MLLILIIIKLKISEQNLLQFQLKILVIEDTMENEPIMMNELAKLATQTCSSEPAKNDTENAKVYGRSMPGHLASIFNHKLLPPGVKLV